MRKKEMIDILEGMIKEIKTYPDNSDYDMGDIGNTIGWKISKYFKDEPEKLNDVLMLGLSKDDFLRGLEHGFDLTERGF